MWKKKEWQQTLCGTRAPLAGNPTVCTSYPAPSGAEAALWLPPEGCLWRPSGCLLSVSIPKQWSLLKRPETTQSGLVCLGP